MGHEHAGVAQTRDDRESHRAYASHEPGGRAHIGKTGR